MRVRSVLGLAAFGATAIVSGACSSDDAAGAVEVVSTKTECTSAATTFKPGKVTFKIVNEGSDPTELYVYDGTKVVGEVENVGPGSSRTLTVSLDAGTYELACKPGQTGNGIRQPITVSES
jgi:iron uptake system component EfeO